MGVPITGESDNVLESLQESLVSNAKLMKAATGWNVSDDLGKSLLLLEFHEFSLEPLKLVTRIISILVGY